VEAVLGEDDVVFDADVDARLDGEYLARPNEIVQVADPVDVETKEVRWAMHGPNFDSRFPNELIHSAPQCGKFNVGLLGRAMEAGWPGGP